jgi:S1-C subfamily serine protease
MNRPLAALSVAAWLLLGAAPPRPIPYLGLEFRWHQDRGSNRFLHVERVAPNGPAHQAGIRPDDLITHIGGVRVDFGDELDFLLFMRDQKPGDRLALTLIRSGRPVKVTAVLGQLPEAARPTWERGFQVAKQKRAAARSARP